MTNECIYIQALQEYWKSQWLLASSLLNIFHSFTQQVSFHICDLLSCDFSNGCYIFWVNQMR